MISYLLSLVLGVPVPTQMASVTVQPAGNWVIDDVTVIPANMIAYPSRRSSWHWI